MEDLFVRLLFLSWYETAFLDCIPVSDLPIVCIVRSEMSTDNTPVVPHVGIDARAIYVWW